MAPQQAIVTAALVAAVMFSGGAWAQRQSLSDRVARLEEQLAAGGDEELRQTLADLVYQIRDLQAEIRELRGTVETQAFELENLRQAQQDQYLDLDARLGALGAGAAGGLARAGGTGADSRPLLDRPADTVAAATAPPREMPEVREAVVADLETRGLGEADAGPVLSVPDPAQEKAAYDAAFEALKNGRYADASREFGTFVERYPNGEFADNAQYWLGESYYVTRNYRVALDTFQRLLTLYPNSAKLPDARLKIGLCYYSLQNWAAAEEELSAVVESYPGTTVSRLAENRLRTMRIEGYID